MIVFSHGGDDAHNLERDPVQGDVGQGEQVEQPQECDGEAQEDPQAVIETENRKTKVFLIFYPHKTFFFTNHRFSVRVAIFFIPTMILCFL